MYQTSLRREIHIIKTSYHNKNKHMKHINKIGIFLTRKTKQLKS